MFAAASVLLSTPPAGLRPELTYLLPALRCRSRDMGEPGSTQAGPPPACNLPSTARRPAAAAALCGLHCFPLRALAVWHG